MRKELKMERIIRAIAGSFVLASLALGWWVSPWFLLFTAFVGANLIQSSITRWCLMEDLLDWLGVADKNALPAARPEAPARPVHSAGKAGVK